MTSHLTQLFMVFLIGTALAANEPNCGTKGPPPHFARIIGGQDAKPHEFPWQCSLQGHLDGPEIVHQCGGAILNKRWILTAGHCADSILEVLCGAHNLAALEGTETRFKVIKRVINPGYWTDDQSVRNDVALLKLDRDLDLENPNAHLGSVCIPDEEPLDQLVGTECIATGWGRTDAPNPNILQKVSLKIWAQEDCKKAWLKADNITIDDGMICFGGGDKSPCNGDSGGPLNCFNAQQGRWFTYGATSFGLRTCSGPTPAVDARISTFSKWIWEEIKKDSE